MLSAQQSATHKLDFTPMSEAKQLPAKGWLARPPGPCCAGSGGGSMACQHSFPPIDTTLVQLRRSAARSPPQNRSRTPDRPTYLNSAPTGAAPHWRRPPLLGSQIAAMDEQSELRLELKRDFTEFLDQDFGRETGEGRYVRKVDDIVKQYPQTKRVRLEVDLQGELQGQTAAGWGATADPVARPRAPSHSF